MLSFRAIQKTPIVTGSLIAISVGLFVHAELQMVGTRSEPVGFHTGALERSRKSVLVPMPVASREGWGTDSPAPLAPGLAERRRFCVTELIQSILEPSPYASVQISDIQIAAGLLKDSFQFQATDLEGKGFTGEGYVTFAERYHPDGSTLECSQSSFVGPWSIRGLRFRLWQDGRKIWEDRDPIG